MTMSMPGFEATLAEIETVLQAGMGAKVTALNAAYADTITLTAPDSGSYHRALDPASQSELEALAFPAIVLRAESEEAQSGPDIGDGYVIEQHVEVAVMVGYDTRERQETALLRYLRAVKELLAPSSSLTCGTVAYKGGGLARTWTTDSGVVRDVAVLFDVTVTEGA